MGGSGLRRLLTKSSLGGPCTSLVTAVANSILLFVGYPFDSKNTRHTTYPHFCQQQIFKRECFQVGSDGPRSNFSTAQRLPLSSRFH